MLPGVFGKQIVPLVLTLVTGLAFMQGGYERRVEPPVIKYLNETSG